MHKNSNNAQNVSGTLKENISLISDSKIQKALSQRREIEVTIAVGGKTHQHRTEFPSNPSADSSQRACLSSAITQLATTPLLALSTPPKHCRNPFAYTPTTTLDPSMAAPSRSPSPL